MNHRSKLALSAHRGQNRVVLKQRDHKTSSIRPELVALLGPDLPAERRQPNLRVRF